MLKRQRQRRRASITSLIDVIFLLLLFFMLASTFTRFAELEVTATTQSAGAASSSTQTAVRLMIEPRSLALNSKPVREESLLSALNAQRKGDTLSVTVRVADEVTTQRLVDILTSLAQVPGISLHLVGEA